MLHCWAPCKRMHCTHRYGYMEQVDHGPDFVRQLIGCLMRFVTQHPDQQHQGYQLANRKGLGAGGSAAAAVVAGGGGGGAALGRTSHQAVTIELQPVDEASSTVPAGAAAADKSLARWSRVPVSPSDCEIVEEMASAGERESRTAILHAAPQQRQPCCCLLLADQHTCIHIHTHSCSHTRVHPSRTSRN